MITNVSLYLIFTAEMLSVSSRGIRTTRVIPKYKIVGSVEN